MSEHTAKLSILRDSTLAYMAADYFKRLADLAEDGNVEINWPHDRENMEILIKALEEQCKLHSNVELFVSHNTRMRREGTELPL